MAMWQVYITHNLEAPLRWVTVPARSAVMAVEAGIPTRLVEAEAGGDA